MKPLYHALLAATLGSVTIAGVAATADELIQACEKLKRADDRATCLREAVRAVAAPPATRKGQAQSDVTASAIQSVVKALRRLNSAASIGINLRDYSQLVVTETANIDEGLRSVPEGRFKAAALESRQAYIDARDLWSDSIRSTYVSVFLISAKPILERHGVDPSALKSAEWQKTSDFPMSILLSPIWANARKALQLAEASTASPTEPPLPSTTQSTPASSSIADQPIVVDPPGDRPVEAERVKVRRHPSPDDRRALQVLETINEQADMSLDVGLDAYVDNLGKNFPALDQALSRLPDDSIKEKLVAARKAYVDAGDVWGMSRQYQYLSQFADAARPTLQRYGVGADMLNSVRIKDMRLMPKHLFLDPIWKTARMNIDDARQSFLDDKADVEPVPKAATPRR